MNTDKKGPAANQSPNKTAHLRIYTGVRDGREKQKKTLLTPATSLVMTHYRKPAQGWARVESEKRAHRILAVPADGGTVETAEDRVKCGTQFNELNHARQMRGCVHVGDAASAGHASEKSQLITPGATLLNVAVEVRCGDTPVVESVAALLDRLPIDGRRVIVLLDELDHHVAGEAHGDGGGGVRGVAAISGVFALEMLHHEPRPDL